MPRKPSSKKPSVTSPALSSASSPMALASPLPHRVAKPDVGRFVQACIDFHGATNIIAQAASDDPDVFIVTTNK